MKNAIQKPGLILSDLKPDQKISSRLKAALSCILKAVGVISKITDTIINDNKHEKQPKSKP